MSSIIKRLVEEGEKRELAQSTQEQGGYIPYKTAEYSEYMTWVVDEEFENSIVRHRISDMQFCRVDAFHKIKIDCTDYNLEIVGHNLKGLYDELLQRRVSYIYQYKLSEDPTPDEFEMIQSQTTIIEIVKLESGGGY